MSNEELVLSYQQGNKESLERLIERNKRFMYKLINRFYVEKTNSIDLDDLEQEATIGLMIAAQKYDFNKKDRANFTTYAFYWMYQKVSRFIKYRNTNDETSLNTPLGEDDDMELLDTVDSHDNSLEDIEDKLYFKQLRTELEEAMTACNTLLERQLLKLHYGWDIKAIVLREAGELLDIDANKAALLKNMALRKLHYSKWGRTLGRKYIRELIGYDDITYRAVEKKIDLEKYLEDVI